VAKTARSAPVFNESRARELVLQLMAIPGPSGQEGRVIESICARLRQAGADPATIQIEPPPPQTPVAGEVGSLIFKLPGTQRGPRRLLMAHLDTVPICVGCQPIVDGQFIRSANPATGVGADDRAGVAVLLSTAMAILEHGLPHPPLTFYWPVQEEIGLYGARHAKLARLGKPTLAFNYDGGPAEKLTCGATGGYRLSIDIQGLASHAGGAPEQGISAIAIASLAIADLVRNGWHGDIRQGKHRGTSNVGVFHGGDATNVVTDHVHLKAEARSHDPKFRAKIVKEIESAFQRAAREVKNVIGKTGRATIEGRLDYESFRLADDERCILAAEEAVRATGGEPYRAISNGGLDANWMSAHGLPTVTLGCGQMNPHTISERLDLAAFSRACQVALVLATAGAFAPPANGRK
jgi:tripeptide aminopeptidase